MTFLFFISWEAESRVLGPNTVALCHRTGLLWAWYVPFRKFYCHQAKSKDCVMILLEVTPRGPSRPLEVGQGPRGKSELRDFFRHGAEPGSWVPCTPARLPAAAFRHERFSLGSKNWCSSHSLRTCLPPSTRHGPAEPWGGVKKADGWQQGSADQGNSGEFEFPQCLLIWWSSLLPSCLPGNQEHLPDSPAGLGSPRGQSF